MVGATVAGEMKRQQKKNRAENAKKSPEKEREQEKKKEERKRGMEARNGSFSLFAAPKEIVMTSLCQPMLLLWGFRFNSLKREEREGSSR